MKPFRSWMCTEVVGLEDNTHIYHIACAYSVYGQEAVECAIVENEGEEPMVSNDQKDCPLRAIRVFGWNAGLTLERTKTSRCGLCHEGIWSGSNQLQRERYDDQPLESFDPQVCDALLVTLRRLHPENAVVDQQVLRLPIDAWGPDTRNALHDVIQYIAGEKIAAEFFRTL